MSVFKLIIGTGKTGLLQEQQALHILLSLI